MKLKLGKIIYNVFFLRLLRRRIFFFFSFMYCVMFDFCLFFEWELFFLNGGRVVIRLLFDWIRLCFLIVVTLISGFIISYSVYYIEGDRDYLRFTFILLIFVGSMVFLIVSPNLISLLLGWDGLGLTSYALVIYYQNESSNNSGIITVLRNRVGDAALLVVIGWCLYLGSYNFIFYRFFDRLLIFLVVLGAITKRAQLPFSAWLPAAIAAPTPVSALVHSSTLVTAGVYLVIRFRGLLSQYKGLSVFCFVVGVLTMFMAGWVANFETDLKKVVALSTLRQLGVIFIILGLNQPLLAFFHLVIHALFKSTLFMCAGFLIHNTRGRQDGRFGGFFSLRSPILGAVFGCTNLALCGFPFLAGFYSKDIILEHVFRGPLWFFVTALVVISTGLTVSYRIRVVYLRRGKRGKINALSVSRDFRGVLLLSSFFLFSIRVFGGFFFSWLILFKGRVFLLNVFEKFYILIVLAFFCVYITLFLSKSFKIIWYKVISHFFSLMVYLPNITSFVLPNFFLMSGAISYKRVDKGWLEYRGPLGLSRGFSVLRAKLQTSQLAVVLTQYFIVFLFIFLLLFRVLVCLKSSKSVALKVQMCNFTLNMFKNLVIFVLKGQCV